LDDFILPTPSLIFKEATNFLPSAGITALIDFLIRALERKIIK
jgi:hypothetical protein